MSGSPVDETKDPHAQQARELPHSATTEAAVLSAWMLKDAFALAWKPEPDLFHVGAHRAVAEAAATLNPKIRDEAALLAELERQGKLPIVGGPAGLFRITKQAPAYGDPFPHLNQLRELAALRSVVKLLEVAANEAYTHRSLGLTVGKVQDVMRTASLASGSQAFSVRELVEMVARRDQTEKTLPRCPSGVPEFDQDTGGLRYTFVTWFAASTNWGKSSFAVMVSDETMKAGMSPLLVSWEDPEDLYARRLIARRKRIKASLLRENRLTAEERNRLFEMLNTAETKPFFVNAIGKSIERVATDVRAICMGEDIDLVIGDYLQAIPCARRIQDRRNEVSYVARTWTDVIKSTEKAGLNFSQIKRLPKGDRPSMMDIKESGDVENAAEMVCIGYQSKNGTPRLWVDKNKDGVKHVEYSLAWDPESCSFLGQLEKEPPIPFRVPKSRAEPQQEPKRYAEPED